nr:vegetative cell wall protein gp1-like [Lolium perenne]
MHAAARRPRQGDKAADAAPSPLSSPSPWPSPPLLYARAGPNPTHGQTSPSPLLPASPSLVADATRSAASPSSSSAQKREPGISLSLESRPSSPSPAAGKRLVAGATGLPRPRRPPPRVAGELGILPSPSVPSLSLCSRRPSRVCERRPRPSSPAHLRRPPAAARPPVGLPRPGASNAPSSVAARAPERRLCVVAGVGRQS